MNDVNGDVDMGYVNDSEALGIYLEAEEQEDTLQKLELHRMAQASPFMDELLAWFDEKIDFYSRIGSIHVNDDLDDWKITRQIMVNTLMTNLLTAKRDELALKYGAYKQSNNPEPGENDG